MLFSSSHIIALARSIDPRFKATVDDVYPEPEFTVSVLLGWPDSSDEISVTGFTTDANGLEDSDNVEVSLLEVTNFWTDDPGLQLQDDSQDFHFAAIRLKWELGKQVTIVDDMGTYLDEHAPETPSDF